MPAPRVSQILAAVMAAQTEEITMPEALCRACADDLPVTGVGMALMTDSGHQGVVAATDGPARVMEDMQLTLGEGPCLDASREGRPVLHPDLARTGPSRWPGFAPAVLEAGIAAIFAYPLQVGGIRLGVLDLYRAESGSLDLDQLADALAFADAAVVILLHLQNRSTDGGGLHPQLSDPLDDRPELHQATGMITVQAAVGLTEAFLLMRAHAFSAERTLLDVAREVVGRRLRFEPEDEHHE